MLNNDNFLIKNDLINLDDIRGHSAISYLEKYEGKNPYLRKLKIEYIKNKKINLTEAQSKYILDNYNKEPLLINRVIAITNYLGEELKTKYNINFVPEKILIEYLLADTEKTYHVYGKLKRNQKESGMYFLPKTQVIDDPYFEPININVDFEPYNTILAKENKFLFEHQKEGIKFLLSRNSCILGDDMGVAKTMQSIIAALETGLKKILVICPSCVKINWEREINRFCNDTAIIYGTKWIGNAKFTIINYDILRNFHTIADKNEVSELNREIINSKFDLIIIDEAHSIKDKDTARSMIISDICLNFNLPRVWLLSGTPIVNKPIDFFNLLKIIKAPIADNWKFFAQRYCEGKRFYKKLKNGKKKQIWLTNGASNLDELALKTKNIMIRRLKRDVLDMPDKIITPLYHELSKNGLNEYSELWDNYLEKRKFKGKKGSVDRDLVELGLLRQFMANESIKHTIDIVENALEYEEKVIIFTNFTEELLGLSEHFGNKCVLHYGGISDTEKQKSVDSFQDNPNIKIIIGNLKSMGVGVNLTAASIVVFNSFNWVPGDVKQAIDRAYRLGQKNNVSVYFNIFKNTIDARVWNKLFTKSEIINIILGKDEENIFIDYESIIDESIN